MRGKPLLLLIISKKLRIIPAHAGQTCGAFLLVSGLPDHPRACGANLIVNGVFNGGSGSSPRMRGKLFPSFHLK